MDYFTALLESYSLLKKRKLNILLEKSVSSKQPSPEAMTKAQEALTAAKGTEPRPSSGNPYRTESLNKVPLGIYYVEKTNTWRVGRIDTKGTASTGYASAAEGSPGFIGKFDDLGTQTKAQPKEEEIQSQQGEIQQLLPQPETIIGPLLSKYEDFKEKLKGAFSSIGLGSRLSRSIFGEVKDSTLAEVARDKLRHILKYIDSSKSLTLLDNGEGKFTFKETKTSNEDLEKISNSIEKIFELSETQDKIKDSKEELKKLIKKNSDGSFTIYSEDGSINIVIASDSGRNFFGALVDGIEEIAQEVEENWVFEENNIIETANYGLSNQIRGTLLEEINVLFNAGRNISKLEFLIGNSKDEAEKKLYQKQLGLWKTILNEKKSGEKLRNKIKLLASMKEEWAEKLKNSGTDLESYEEWSSLRELFDNNAQNLFLAARSLVEETNASKADFIIHAGKTTKFGRRRDTIEIFKSQPEGKINEDFKVIKSDQHLQDLIGDDYGLYKELLGSGPWYVSTQSYKHYLYSSDDMTVTAGETSFDSERRFLTRDKISEEDNKELIKLGNSKFKVQDSAVNYAGELYSIHDSIDSLTHNSLFSGGEAAAPVATLKTILDKVQSGLSYDSKDENFTQIKAKVESFVKSKNKQKKFEEIKEDLKRMVLNLKIKKDIESGNKSKASAAKEFLISRMVQSGGSVDPAIKARFRILSSDKNKQKRYSYSQNDVLLKIAEGIRKGSLKLSFSSTSITISDANGTLFGRVGTSKKGTRTQYTESAIKAAGSKEAPLGESQRIQSMNLLSALIESQKALLNSLLELEKKGDMNL